MSKQDKKRPAAPDAPENQGRRTQDQRQAEGPGETPIYLSGNSTLQTPEEHRHDQQVDPRRDNRMDVGNEDRHEVRLGRLTGRDENDSDKA